MLITTTTTRNCQNCKEKANPKQLQIKLWACRQLDNFFFFLKNCDKNSQKTFKVFQMTTPFHNSQKIKYKRNSKQTNVESLYGERLTSEYSYLASVKVFLLFPASLPVNVTNKPCIKALKNGKPLL